MALKEFFSDLKFTIDKRKAGVIPNYGSSFGGKLMQEKTLLEKEKRFANSTGDKILLNKISRKIDNHNGGVVYYVKRSTNTEN